MPQHHHASQRSSKRQEAASPDEQESCTLSSMILYSTVFHPASSLLPNHLRTSCIPLHNAHYSTVHSYDSIMGNAASREVAKQAQKAAGSGAQTAAKAPRPPPLGRSSADAPDVIEDPQAPLRQRQLQETQALLQPEPKRTAPVPARPPVPDGNSGFFRGQISDPRDVAQEKFLLHQSGGNQKDQQELAPDLLKFLQDAGPLEKKVNKVSQGA